MVGDRRRTFRAIRRALGGNCYRRDLVEVSVCVWLDDDISQLRLCSELRGGPSFSLSFFHPLYSLSFSLLYSHWSFLELFNDGKDYES